MKLKFLYNPPSLVGPVKYKFFLVMKLTAILLFIGVLHLSAASYAQNVSISRHNSSLETIFKDIKTQTGYTFFYTDKINTTQQNLNVDLKNVSLKEALDYCLKGLRLTYTIVNKTIVIRQAEPDIKVAVPDQPTEQQPIEVKGTVTDDVTQAPMAGVNIYLSTDKKAVIATTNQKGEFQLTLEPGTVVVFTFIGYKPSEVKINDSKALNVKMTLSVNAMNDVVVTGYQTIKKDNYTGNAITLTGDELKSNNPTDVIKAISAFDPSVRIGQNNLTGSNPNALPQLTVRGSTTLPSVNGAIVDRNNLSSSYDQPAFMLDGFPATLEQVVDLDINRIATVTILKDAAATAVYGSRAANGVIVITTKVPKVGKLQLTYNAELDISAPDLSTYHVLNASQKLQYEKLAGLYTANSLVSEASQYDLDQDYNNKLKNVVSGINTDWLAQPVQNAFGIKHTLDADGGDSTFRYTVTGNYKTDPGVMIGSSRNTYGGGVTFFYNPSKAFLFRNQLTITQENSTDSPYGNFSTYAAMNPYYTNDPSVQDLANYEIANPLHNQGPLEGDEFHTESVLNPLYEAHVGDFSKSAYLEVLDNLSLDYYITPALRLQGLIGLTDHKGTSDVFVSPVSNVYYNDPASDIENRGSYTYGTDNSLAYDAQLRLIYNKQIGNNSINLLGLSEIINNTDDQKDFVARGFSNATFTNVTFARSYDPYSAPTGGITTVRSNNNSITGNYAYQNKYLLDVTGNLSGSSLSGANQRYAPGYSAGLGWNMHNEDFMKKDFPAISKLRISATTGLTSSVDFPPDLAKTIYSYQTANWYSTGVGALVDAYGNDQLQLSKTTNYDLIFDLGLFKNRLEIQPDLYYKLTKGSIQPVNIAPSTGFLTYETNIGDVKNVGEEVYLTWNAYKTSNWNVNITANIVANKNAVVHLSSALQAYNASVSKYQTDTANRLQTSPLLHYAEGQSINTIYAVVSKGIDPENGKEIFVKRDGTLTYVYDVADQVPVGNSDPKGSGTFGSNITYKQFFLSFIFHYQFGGDYYNQDLVDDVENADPRYNVDSRALAGRWEQPGDIALYKNITDLSITQPTSRFVQRDNEIDLESVNLSYSLSKKTAKKIGVSSMRISLIANDVFNAQSITYERGVDYPYARNLSVTLQATF